ncbi:MAG TPA: radical SAM protein [Porphyromonadaceae bacterium]|nr:radical SAM protein [Porphyromonadaceae bacterium]
MAENQTVLFHSTVFGPIHSRRLGTSLGINLAPDDGKVCTFDCIYCEAGYNRQGTGTTGLATREKLEDDLRRKLAEMHAAGMDLDVITFSGNGEPTINPDFPAIVDTVIALRDEFYPEAKVSVLTNSTRIFTPAVASALDKVDNNILKLDSAVEETMRLIDNPTERSFTVAKAVEGLCRFAGTGIIQTMMLRGKHNGKAVDNTTDAEIDALIEAYQRIKPREVMLYSLDRSTPEENLVKVEHDELERIADRIRRAGITVAVS